MKIILQKPSGATEEVDATEIWSGEIKLTANEKIVKIYSCAFYDSFILCINSEYGSKNVFLGIDDERAWKIVKPHLHDFIEEFKKNNNNNITFVVINT